MPVQACDNNGLAFGIHAAMIISNRHRFIFFAVPKTGTHSVRQALRPFLADDDMEQVGHTLDNALTISGGNDRTTFFLSGGATNQRGSITGANDKFDRYSVSRFSPATSSLRSCAIHSIASFPIALS